MSVRAFTPRAFGFAASALAFYLAGRLTGVAELFMLALAALLLPLGSLAVVATSRGRLAASRTARPARVPVTGRVTVRLHLKNPSRVATGVLLVEDRVPYQLGSPARFVVPGVEAGRSEELRYELVAGARGRYELGPLTVRLTDPFGLAQVSSALAGTSEVLVHPRVEQLSPPGYGGQLTAASATRVRRLYSRGEEFYTTREYRDGDDLRKVHWRSSAKRGQLMIRQEETPWQARALLAVDLRRAAHRGQGEQGSFERTVSVVASLAVRLASSGYELALLTDGGEHVRPASRADQATPILDFLATVTPSRGDSLLPLASRLAHASGEGLLLAVLTVPSPEEAAALARCRLGFGGALGLIVRPESWLGLGAREAAEADARLTGTATMLQRAGWRIATLTRTQRLEEPWHQLTAPLGRGTPSTARRSR